MSADRSVALRAALRWRRTPVLAIGLGGAALIAGVGLALSRADVVAIGLPLALATAWALVRRPDDGEMTVTLSARSGGGPEAPEARGSIDVAAPADWVQLAIDQGERRTGSADVRPGVAAVTSTSRLQHSGPSEILGVTARCVALDGAWITDVSPMTRLTWNTPPRARRLSRIPVGPRLTGLHGSHEGSKPGQGGDFRDIHPFAPGDALRRVDWRATARSARQPGDLMVRRSNALSDSAVVLAIDTAEDLGAVVASWGSGDPERSGVTSLDLAREAALSIADAAIGTGDRVEFHALSVDGRSIPAGGGVRHLARIRAAIAATGASGDQSRYRRTPVVTRGSIVFVISAFFDGAAAELATRWRAAGHAVIAVDVLPELQQDRLGPAQRVAMRTLLAERTDILAELSHAGIDVVAWTADDPDAEMRLAVLRQQRTRAVRR